MTLACTRGPRFLHAHKLLVHAVLHLHLEAMESFFGLLFNAASLGDILGTALHSPTVSLRSPS